MQALHLTFLFVLQTRTGNKDFSDFVYLLLFFALQYLFSLQRIVNKYYNDIHQRYLNNQYLEIICPNRLTF